METRTIIKIYVEGGVVTDCTSNDKDIEVQLIDYDNEPDSLENPETDLSDFGLHAIYQTNQGAVTL